MTAKRVTGTPVRVRGDDLMQRLQSMLYEYHDLGRFEDARPHILWLMEIAEAESRKPRPLSRLS
ncbi:MAG TPA: hypothetical protein VNU97_16555 [Rhizomicrobium sp.]|nr:hypothetical protein [Rhizomicrobium sp.]